MDNTVVEHMVKQGVFNNAVGEFLTNQEKVNKAFAILVIACGACLYFNNKKIGKLTSEVKELKQMKGA